MLTYEDAIAQILAKVAPLPPTESTLRGALSLVLAQDIIAPRDIPPFANSAMDGYAVRFSDVPSVPVTLPIAYMIAAGDASPAFLAPGQAAAIFTGAPVPDGADTIIPIEDTEKTDQGVIIKEVGTQGQFVRPRGEDVTAGQTVLTSGTILRPAEIGLLAALGQPFVLAYPRPRVAIISTGDELVEPRESLRPGQIYNSNAYALAAQVEEAGAIVMHLLHARDTPEALRDAFDRCQGADVLITSGGVSVGDHDYVKATFAERGSVDFWRVAIRPGKPLAFGVWENTLFFGLPGNPVSSMVTFELFARPALRQLRGHADIFRAIVQAKLTEEARHEPGRRSYQRASVSRENDAYFAHPTAQQGSGMLRSMTLSNALLVLPADITSIPSGDFASVLLLD